LLAKDLLLVAKARRGWPGRPSVGTMGGSITVNGVTYPDGTATQSLALNNSVNYTYLTTYYFPGGEQQVVVNGFITFGWADPGFFGGYIDLVMLGDWISQPAVALQLTNGSPCYCVHIETVGGGGFIGRSANIAIVPLHRYSFSLLFDEINGLAKLTIFDPSNNFTQVGSTVTVPQTTGSTFHDVSIWQCGSRHVEWDDGVFRRAFGRLLAGRRAASTTLDWRIPTANHTTHS
jgi:hypothetical protein